MEYFLAIGLTFVVLLAIIKWSNKRQIKYFNAIKHRQSSVYEDMKYLFPNKVNNKIKIESQSTRHVKDHMVKIIVIDNKAYWVKDNIFYMAETDNGTILSETAVPVETVNMSKTDVDKMLFILDNLKEGNKDERGSSGNE